MAAWFPRRSAYGVEHILPQRGKTIAQLLKEAREVVLTRTHDAAPMPAPKLKAKKKT